MKTISKLLKVLNMDDRIKKIMVPLLLMVILNSISFLWYGANYPKTFTPRVGVLIISGLIFGPYGAVGAVIGNVLTDMLKSHGLALMITNAISGGCISYLAYKLWYGTITSRPVINRPKFNNTTNVILFLVIIFVCSILYTVLERKFIFFIDPANVTSNFLIEVRYFLNHINVSFIIGIVGIWFFSKLDFVHIPKTSKRKLNKKLYDCVGIALIVLTLVITIADYYFAPNFIVSIMELILLLSLLLIFLTKPITAKIQKARFNSIPEAIMNIFLLATVIIAVLGFIVGSDSIFSEAIFTILPKELEDFSLSIMIIMDIFLVIYFIPSIAVLRYIENKVIDPIISFSRIEKFVKKGNKIESDGLINVYSNYLDENNEIGMLARSYTNLIEYNNDYIEHIYENEREKEKLKTELEIAANIQKSILPTTSIIHEDYTVYGFSKPAKSVGGDFYDYYQLDEDNVAIMIGDASGKGMPAALLSTVTHSIVRQILKSEMDPSRVLHLLNNQVCENNPDNTFITSWLGIYNNKTKILTFSNAGHNAPLIFEDGKFKTLKVNSGIALGILEDYEFLTEEVIISKGILAYTDGITDARNLNKEFYGEDNLINFLNKHPFENKSVTKLFDDIGEFMESEEQFDDMTLVVLERFD